MELLIVGVSSLIYRSDPIDNFMVVSDVVLYVHSFWACFYVRFLAQGLYGNNERIWIAHI